MNFNELELGDRVEYVEKYISTISMKTFRETFVASHDFSGKRMWL